mgnify:CR=1 FL=1
MVGVQLIAGDLAEPLLPLFSVVRQLVVECSLKPAGAFAMGSFLSPSPPRKSGTSQFLLVHRKGLQWVVLYEEDRFVTGNN